MDERCKPSFQAGIKNDCGDDGRKVDEKYFHLQNKNGFDLQVCVCLFNRRHLIPYT
jgi:hypothetical protein